MAAAKIKTSWDEDIYGDSILLVEKSRGKLNLEEVADAIRYNWQLQGRYIMMINATEATCGADWDPFGELEKRGDMWELYRIEEMEKCPVCKRITPFLHCCPECGKLEFFAAENREHSQAGVPQVTCPKCGRPHDFDYPSCPFCKHQY